MQQPTSQTPRIWGPKTNLKPGYRTPDSRHLRQRHVTQGIPRGAMKVLKVHIFKQQESERAYGWHLSTLRHSAEIVTGPRNPSHGRKLIQLAQNRQFNLSSLGWTELESLHIVPWTHGQHRRLIQNSKRPCSRTRKPPVLIQETQRLHVQFYCTSTSHQDKRESILEAARSDRSRPLPPTSASQNCLPRCRTRSYTSYKPHGGLWLVNAQRTLSGPRGDCFSPLRPVTRYPKRSGVPAPVPYAAPYLQKFLPRLKALIGSNAMSLRALLRRCEGRAGRGRPSGKPAWTTRLALLLRIISWEVSFPLRALRNKSLLILEIRRERLD